MLSRASKAGADKFKGTVAQIGRGIGKSDFLVRHSLDS
jgi:hypothetical protein